MTLLSLGRCFPPQSFRGQRIHIVQLHSTWSAVGCERAECLTTIQFDRQFKSHEPIVISPWNMSWNSWWCNLTPSTSVFRIQCLLRAATLPPFVNQGDKEVKTNTVPRKHKQQLAVWTERKHLFCKTSSIKHCIKYQRKQPVQCDISGFRYYCAIDQSHCKFNPRAGLLDDFRLAIVLTWFSSCCLSECHGSLVGFRLLNDVIEGRHISLLSILFFNRRVWVIFTWSLSLRGKIFWPNGRKQQ